MYFVLATVVPIEAESNRLLTIVLSAVSVLMTGASFAAKKVFLARSVELQQPKLVNTAYIAAAACCEAGALFGLMDKFVTADPYYYLLLVLPSSDNFSISRGANHLEAANFKKLQGLNVDSSQTISRRRSDRQDVRLQSRAPAASVFAPAPAPACSRFVPNVVA